MIIHQRYLLSQRLSQEHELPFAQASKGILSVYRQQECNFFDYHQ